MEINIIDTNIAFDLIFDGRNRNKRAMAFYRNFKNLELIITDVIKKESIKVIFDYSMTFEKDLINFLQHKNNFGKGWDKLNYSGKCNLIEDFSKDIKNNDIKKAQAPFYSNFLSDINYTICDMKYIDIMKYMMELPGEMQRNFMNSSRKMFTTLNIDNEIDNYREKENIIKDAIQQYFKNNESKDLNILINLIILANFGEMEGTNIDSLNFYTCDEKFIKNFKNVIKDKKNIIETINKSFTIQLESIKFKRMGDVHI